MKQRPAAVICVIALSWLATACKEQVISGPGFVCDVTNPVRDVSISPSNASVLVRSPARTTDVIQLIATATNRLGDPRADVPFTFTSSDPAIATVDSTGLVHALKPGAVSIKASTCGESATAQITVINAVVTVTVTPAAQSALVGDSVLVTARARGQTGDSLPDVKFTFAVSPPASATIKVVNDSTVYVFPTVAGNLTVTATGEGASSSTVIAVLPRSFLSGAVNVPALDVGNSYACGLISLGRAYCWGLNDHSQLGTVTDSVCFDDTRTHTDTSQTQTVVKPCSLLPRPVSPDISFVNVSAGDSSALCCCYNGQGLLLGHQHPWRARERQQWASRNSDTCYGNSQLLRSDCRRRACVRPGSWRSGLLLGPGFLGTVGGRGLCQQLNADSRHLRQQSGRLFQHQCRSETHVCLDVRWNCFLLGKQ